MIATEVKTIEQYAEFVRKELNRLSLAPEGAEVATVTVLNGCHRESARRKRSNAAVANNLEVGDSLFITFQPLASATRVASLAAPKPGSGPAVPPPQPAAAGTRLDDIVKALAQAEQTPGHSFVALKWFRDSYLPSQHAWASDVDLRNDTLRTAIDCGLILVNRLPNPKNPQFPTSALRLNRAGAAAQRILGPAPRRWGFTPIELPGEPLSETVRRMRDEGY